MFERKTLISYNIHVPFRLKLVCRVKLSAINSLSQSFLNPVVLKLLNLPLSFFWVKWAFSVLMEMTWRTIETHLAGPLVWLCWLLYCLVSKHYERCWLSYGNCVVYLSHTYTLTCWFSRSERSTARWWQNSRDRWPNINRIFRWKWSKGKRCR